MNGQDVSRMDHSDVVTLIKASGTTITLEVQQPQGVWRDVVVCYLLGIVYTCTVYVCIYKGSVAG